MANYGLDPNGMLDTGAELQGITKSIQQTVDELNNDVVVFITHNTGRAQEAFTTAQSDWQSGMDEMNSALTVGIQRLNQIHDLYRMGDAQGAALFGGNV